MSLKTWKEEFYPVEADKVPEEHAIAHSLQKWIGLRKENLEKHKCKITDRLPRSVVNDHTTKDSLPITWKSCALCQHYDGPEEEYHECNGCPLKQLRDRPCDQAVLDSDEEAPYTIFVATLDPEPMIELLEQALRVAHGIHS